MHDATPYSIVAAARTDAYLPLFLAAERDWYGYVPLGHVKLIDPEAIENEDTDTDKRLPDQDSWVVNCLLSKAKIDNVILGFCDPFQLLLHKDKESIIIVGSLLSKASFWIYDTDETIDNLHESSKFSNVVCPSSGMTGFRFFQLIKTLVKEKQKAEWEPHTTEERIERLFHAFETKVTDNMKENTGKKTLLITPNPYELELANKQQRPGRPRFQRCYSLPLHPVWGDFLTTAIITNRFVLDHCARPAGVSIDDAEERKTMVLGVLKGLQRALIEIVGSSSSSEIENVFLERVYNLKKYTKVNREAAKAVIKMLTDERVFPIDLTVTPSAWASRMHLNHRINGGGNPDEASVKRDMQRFVNNDIAIQAFHDVVVEPVQNSRSLHESLCALNRKLDEKVKNRTGSVEYAAAFFFLILTVFFLDRYLASRELCVELIIGLSCIGMSSIVFSILFIERPILRAMPPLFKWGTVLINGIFLAVGGFTPISFAAQKVKLERDLDMIFVGGFIYGIVGLFMLLLLRFYEARILKYFDAPRG